MTALQAPRSGEPVTPSENDIPTSETPRVGAAMALADVVLVDADFWTGPPIPALPLQAALPTDLLLRQLPEPGAALGGRDLVTYLAPLYARIGEE